jgi:hypothetical protein
MSQLRVNSILSSGGGSTTSVNGIPIIFATAAEVLEGVRGDRLVGPDTFRTAMLTYSGASAAVLSQVPIPTGATTATFSGLDLTIFKLLRVVINGASGTSTLTITLNGFSVVPTATASAAATVTADIWLTLENGKGFSSFSTGNTSRQGTHTLTSSSTSITLTGSSSFDAGTISVWGLR